MLTQEQVDQFNRDGYLRGNRILDDDAVEVLRNELARVIENRDNLERNPVHVVNFGSDDSAIWQVVNMWEASEPYHALISHPVVTAEIAQLTGAQELRIWHDQIQYKPATCGGVNMWHQDAPYWPVIKPMTEVSAWIALDDVDESNGCMSMVPGSHKWGNKIDFIHTLVDFKPLPSEFEGHALRAVACPVKKGEVHYHHSLTWHGSHENKSGRPRRAIALHYMTEETRFVASGEHVMKQFIGVSDNELMQGEHFPLVWSSHGAVVQQVAGP